MSELQDKLTLDFLRKNYEDALIAEWNCYGTDWSDAVFYMGAQDYEPNLSYYVEKGLVDEDFNEDDCYVSVAGEIFSYNSLDDERCPINFDRLIDLIKSNGFQAYEEEVDCSSLKEIFIENYYEEKDREAVRACIDKLEHDQGYKYDFIWDWDSIADDIETETDIECIKHE